MSVSEWHAEIKKINDDNEYVIAFHGLGGNDIEKHSVQITLFFHFLLHNGFQIFTKGVTSLIWDTSNQIIQRMPPSQTDTYLWHFHHCIFLLDSIRLCRESSIPHAFTTNKQSDSKFKWMNPSPPLHVWIQTVGVTHGHFSRQIQTLQTRFFVRHEL